MLKNLTKLSFMEWCVASFVGLIVLGMVSAVIRPVYGAPPGTTLIPVFTDTNGVGVAGVPIVTMTNEWRVTASPTNVNGVVRKQDLDSAVGVATNNIGVAGALKTTGANVVVSNASPPGVSNVFVTTSPTTGNWVPVSLLTGGTSSLLTNFVLSADITCPSSAFTNITDFTYTTQRGSGTLVRVSLFTGADSVSGNPVISRIDFGDGELVDSATGPNASGFNVNVTEASKVLVSNTTIRTYFRVEGSGAILRKNLLVSTHTLTNVTRQGITEE